MVRFARSASRDRLKSLNEPNVGQFFDRKHEGIEDFLQALSFEWKIWT